MHTKLLTLALGGLLTLGTTAAALAQEAPSPPPDQNQAGPPPQGPNGRGMRMDPDRQLARLTRELNLTSDQQEKIKPLLIDRQQKAQALFQDQSLTPEDRRRQMRTIAEGANNNIKAVLDDYQKKKFEEMQQRMRRNRPEGVPGGPPPPPPDGSATQPQF